MTVQQTYSKLYNNKKQEYILAGYTEDKSSRMANKFAVQNTWVEYNKGRL